MALWKNNGVPGRIHEPNASDTNLVGLANHVMCGRRRPFIQEPRNLFATITIIFHDPKIMNILEDHLNAPANPDVGQIQLFV